MIKVAKIQFHKLDKEYYFLAEFTDDQRHIVSAHQQVIVDTSMGQDLATVTEVSELSSEDIEKIKSAQVKSVGDFKPLTRPARKEEIARVKDLEQNYSQYLKSCHELCQKHGLKEMKLIDVSESLDGNRLTYYFISNTRVDFRELVKDLANIFHKKIRLQQIGVRDAAKSCGDFGPCGLPLCCKAWLDNIGNVNPDSIKNQELMHRGVDRLTGVCGRLKCCLRFEEENYRFAEDNPPQVGDIIKTKLGEAKVKAVYPDKQLVTLEIDGKEVEYPYLDALRCKCKKCPS